MNESIKDRIEKIRVYYGLGMNKFESMCGLSHGYIFNLKGDIGSSKLLNIIAVFPDIDPLWLLTGEGEMLKTKAEPQEVIEITDNVRSFNSHTNDNEIIKELTAIIQSQQERIRQLTDKLLGL